MHRKWHKKTQVMDKTSNYNATGQTARRIQTMLGRGMRCQYRCLFADLWRQEDKEKGLKLLTH